MKSRYIVFPEAQKVEVREETMTPPGPNEVLGAAEKSLVSIGTESHCLGGIFEPGSNWADWVVYPFRPGYSMAGRVAAVGRNVTTFKEGDRVAAWVTHQQLFKAPAADLHPIPAAVSDEEATWAILACTTQLGIRRAKLELGERVGVIGLGILGQLVVQYLALSGARQIVAIDPVQSRLELAARHGATHTLTVEAAGARPEVEKITGGYMLDVVYDITGHPAVLPPAILLLRKLGRLILLGDTPTPSQQHLGPGVVSNSIAILGIHGTMMPAQPSEFNPWTAREMAALFFDYLVQGRMRVADLVTHRYSPLDAPKVYARLQRERAGVLGVIFDWSLL